MACSLRVERAPSCIPMMSARMPALCLSTMRRRAIRSLSSKRWASAALRSVRSSETAVVRLITFGFMVVVVYQRLRETQGLLCFFFCVALVAYAVLVVLAAPCDIVRAPVDHPWGRRGDRVIEWLEEEASGFLNCHGCSIAEIQRNARFILLFFPIRNAFLEGLICLLDAFPLAHYLGATRSVDDVANRRQLMLPTLIGCDVEDRIHPVQVNPILSTVFVHDLNLVIFEGRVGYYSPSVPVEHHFAAVADALVFLNCHESIIPQPELTTREKMHF